MLPKQRRNISGFSLVELMVAITLGLLVSAGIITLFSTTSKTNRVQDSLARLQENGRYGITRIESDLRMLGGQFRSNNSGTGWTQTANGAVFPGVGPRMNVTGFVFPDSGGLVGGPPAGWPAATTYDLSPRFFVQSYECGTGTCTPAVPTGASGFPAAGAAVGNRVVGSDVITIRYQNGSGWPYTVTGSGLTTSITLVPRASDDPLNFVAGDLALLADCSGETVFAVNVAGSVLTPIAARLLSAAQLKPGPGTAVCDPRIFNFSRDFNTVSYWLQLAADPNPDAAAGRLIPVLMRRLNGGTAQELMQGMERLDFLFGVQDINGAIRYLTADQVETQSTVGNCPAPPAGIALEAGCLWRSVKSVEVHALLNTVNDIDLSPVDTAYRYSIDGTTVAAPAGATMPVSSLPVGRMMRREFLSLISVRNGNP